LGARRLIWCNSSIRTRTPLAVCGRAGCLKSKHENLITWARALRRMKLHGSLSANALRLLCLSLVHPIGRAVITSLNYSDAHTHNVYGFAKPSAFRWQMASELGCNCLARRSPLLCAHQDICLVPTPPASNRNNFYFIGLLCWLAAKSGQHSS
jgi:hypothetical protein